MSGSESPGAPEWLCLDRDEAVRLRAAPSKNLLLGGFGVGFVILIVGSVAVSALGDIRTGRALSAGMLVVILGLLAGVYVVIARRDYVLTSERACERVGLTATEITEVELDRVTDISLERPSWQRWLGVGSLQLVADGETEVRFSYVENPKRVLERVAEHVAAAR